MSITTLGLNEWTIDTQKDPSLSPSLPPSFPFFPPFLLPISLLHSHLPPSPPPSIQAKQEQGQPLCSFTLGRLRTEVISPPHLFILSLAVGVKLCL